MSYNSQELHDKLLEFSCNEVHETSDFAFIVFMGHGWGGHSVKMKVAKEEDVDIFDECQACCSNPASKLQGKPKTIIVQTCRRKYLYCTFDIYIHFLVN